jgi:O-antigen ligase
VLAFFTGGYLDDARAWAGLIAWVLVVVGAVVGELPRSRATVLAIGGAVAFAAWTLVSVVWAPVSGPAWDAGQIALLYAGVLIAAALLLEDWVEPALLLGIVVVVGYGLSERLLPGILDFTQSVSAQGRLEQPLTYWNGMGVVAAMGVVLCARLVAVPPRPVLRAAAAAAAAPLGLGLGLTVSRGALLACAAGLVALVVLTRRREQLAAVLGIVAIGAVAAAVAAPFDGVTSLTGDHRELEGAIVLVALIVLMAVAVVAARHVDRHAGELRLPRGSGMLAVAVVGVGFGVAILAGTEQRGPRELTPDAGRLVTLKSNRYEYWRVAVRAFGAQPVRGAGAGGWAVRWRRERPFRESAHDAHSLYLQTAAELGLIGLVLLGIWFGGVALAARAGPPGLAAVCAVWAVHVLLDWDFELPAATLPAMVAAGALLTSSRRDAAA